MSNTIDVLSAKEARALSDYPVLTLGRISECIKAAAENSSTQITYELEYPSPSAVTLIVDTLREAGYTIACINGGFLRISW